MEPNKTDGNYLRSIYFKNYLGTGKDLKLRLHNDSPEPMHSARFITGPNGWGKSVILQFIGTLLNGCTNPEYLPKISDSGELKLTKASITWEMPSEHSLGKIERQGVGIPGAVRVTTETTYPPECLPAEEKAIFDDWFGQRDIVRGRYSTGHGRIAAIIHLAFRSKAEGKVLLIDEPEEHLHLSIQREFSNRIDELTDQSILCATHSARVIQRMRRSVDLFEQLPD